MTLQNAINWMGLLLSVGLTIYGAVGLKSGKVTASSYALNTESTYTGKKAVFLAVCWLLLGLVGTTAFAGHMLGIKQVAPLYDFVEDLLKSD